MYLLGASTKTLFTLYDDRRGRIARGTSGSCGVLDDIASPQLPVLDNETYHDTLYCSTWSNYWSERLDGKCWSEIRNADIVQTLASEVLFEEDKFSSQALVSMVVEKQDTLCINLLIVICEPFCSRLPILSVSHCIDRDILCVAKFVFTWLFWSVHAKPTCGCRTNLGLRHVQVKSFTR